MTGGGEATRGRRPAPERVRLDNGLTVLIQRHGGAPAVAVQLWVRVGARNETGSESGLSHFIEHLLFKGTPTRGPGIIDQTISGLGGEMNAATSQDFTYYHVVLPSRHAETALDVVGDAAMHPTFEPVEVERERLVVLEEIRRADDSPTAYLWRVLARRHFGDHPYGRPVLGTPATIEAAGRDAIVAYFRRHYLPNNAVLVVAGDIERDAILGHVRKVFDAWEPGAPPDAGIGRAAPVAGRERVEETRPLQQAYLGVAWQGPLPPDPDVYAVDLLVSVLGQGRASRLNQALRERLGLVSSVGASFYTQHDAGTIMVSARTTAERRQAVENAVLVEVEALRATPVSEDELARARTAVEAGYAFGHETAEGVAYAYGSAETVWTLEFELGYLDEVSRVTREQVREAARRYLVLDRFTVAALEPRAGGTAEGAA